MRKHPPTMKEAQTMTKTIDQPWQLEPSLLAPPFTNLAPMRPTCREFLVGVGGALLVVAAPGCGGVGGGEASGETRTISHEMGETEVPEDPRRVVVLDPFFSLQTAVEIGVPIVGSDVHSQAEPFSNVLTRAETKGIESVGDARQPDLEKIATFEPDLILATTFVEPPYDELSQIAPTVVFADSIDWKAYVRDVGEATDRTDAVEEGLTGYEARVEEIRGQLRSVTVSFASFVGGPLWQQIPAVQNGEAYQVDPNRWLMFGGLHSANLVLDDVEKYLT